MESMFSYGLYLCAAVMAMGIFGYMLYRVRQRGRGRIVGKREIRSTWTRRDARSDAAATSRTLVALMTSPPQIYVRLYGEMGESWVTCDAESYASWQSGTEVDVTYYALWGWVIYMSNPALVLNEISLPSL